MQPIILTISNTTPTGEDVKLFDAANENGSLQEGISIESEFPYMPYSDIIKMIKFCGSPLPVGEIRIEAVKGDFYKVEESTGLIIVLNDKNVQSGEFLQHTYKAVKAIDQQYIALPNINITISLFTSLTIINMPPNSVMRFLVLPAATIDISKGLNTPVKVVDKY